MSLSKIFSPKGFKDWVNVTYPLCMSRLNVKILRLLEQSTEVVQLL